MSAQRPPVSQAAIGFSKADADALLAFWFGPLDDDAVLDRTTEPFATHFRRWYGKDPRIDEEIRARFGPLLTSVTASAASWRQAEALVRDDPRRSLALTILIDQVPRNIHRDQPEMYAYDGLALAFTYAALERGHAAALSLPERMFALVPLMHVEDLTMQRLMEEQFAALRDASRTRSPQSTGFYDFALDFARRHREVIERFGRFPHRNLILGRLSRPDERAALRDEDIAF